MVITITFNTNGIARNTGLSVSGVKGRTRGLKKRNQGLAIALNSKGKSAAIVPVPTTTKIAEDAENGEIQETVKNGASSGEKAGEMEG